MSTCSKDEYKSSSKISSLEQCKVYHILDILNNSTILNSNKAIVDGQHKNKILSYFEEQMIDGQKIKLHLQNKKQFAEQLSTYLNTRKVYGASMALMREFNNIDFDNINLYHRPSTPPLITQSITEPIHAPISFPDYIDKYKTIQTCNTEEFEYILDHYLFQHHDIKQTMIISENKHHILSYFRNGNINGAQALNMKRSNFMSNISQHCNNNKLKAPLGKLYKILHNNSSREYRISLLSDNNSESGEETKEENVNMEQQNVFLDLETVNVNHIVYVIKYYIFQEIKDKIKQLIIDKQDNSNHSLLTIKNKIIEYFEMNDINGSRLKNEKRTKFAKSIAVYVYDQSLMGLMAKLYTQLKQFEWSNVDWNMDSSNDDEEEKEEEIEEVILPPTSIEECNMEQMVYLLSNHICSSDEFTKPRRKKLQKVWQTHENKIINYFRENNVNGSDVTNTKKKTFAKSLATYCDKTNNKLTPSMVQLHDAITNFEFDEHISSEISMISISKITSSKRKNENNNKIKQEPEEEKYELVKIQKEIKQCNCIELIFVLHTYIFTEHKLQKQYAVLKDYKSQIISYFEDNNINGLSVFNMNRKDFAQKIVNNIGNSKLSGPLRKLYAILTDTVNKNNTIKTKYDIPLQFNENDLQSHLDNIVVINNEEMNNQQLVQHINNLLNQNKWTEIEIVNLNRDGIISFVKAKGLTGKQMKEMNQKGFAEAICIHIGNRKLMGKMKELHRDIFSA